MQLLVWYVDVSHVQSKHILMILHLVKKKKCLLSWNLPKQIVCLFQKSVTLKNFLGSYNSSDYKNQSFLLNSFISIIPSLKSMLRNSSATNVTMQILTLLFVHHTVRQKSTRIVSKKATQSSLFCNKHLLIYFYSPTYLFIAFCWITWLRYLIPTF